MLYALLAGCGPLRVGEALGLEIDKHISSDFRTLQIVKKSEGHGDSRPFEDEERRAPGGPMHSIGAHAAGVCREPSQRLSLPNRKWQSTLSIKHPRDSLHPLLVSTGNESGGFNIFRRFRRTHIETAEFRKFYVIFGLAIRRRTSASVTLNY